MKKLVLFIHGLGGSAVKTWGSFPNLLNSDSEISKIYSIDFYSYPTRLLTLFRNIPRIQSLAQGLRTELEYRYVQYSDIMLICHSLGGLVARQYLIEEVKSNRPIRVSRLLLYTTPNNGADLANIGRLFPWWRHYQIRQLCRNSEFLDSLNNDWSTFFAEKRVAVKYIIGGLDRFVSEPSAKGQWGTEHCETIIGKGHRDIVKPTTADDLAFLIARQFMLSEDLNQAFRAVTAAKPMVPSKATTEDLSSQVHLPAPVFAFTDSSSQPAADTAMHVGRDDLRILAANVRCPSAELHWFFDFKRQQNDDRIRILEQYNSVENILEIAAAPMAGNGVQWGWDPMCITATVVGNLDPLPAIHDQELYESLSRNPPNKPKFVFAEDPCALPDNESYVTFKLKRTDFIQTVLASRALARDPSLRDLYGDYNSAENRFPYGTSVELIVLLIDGTILVCQKGRQSIHEGGKWSVSSEETLDDTDFRYEGEQKAISHLVYRAIVEEIFGIPMTPPLQTHINPYMEGDRKQRYEEVKKVVASVRIWNVFYKLDYSSFGFCGLAQLKLDRESFSQYCKYLRDRFMGVSLEATTFFMDRSEAEHLSTNRPAKCYNAFDQNTQRTIEPKDLTHTSLFRLRFLHKLGY